VQVAKNRIQTECGARAERPWLSEIIL